VRDKQAFSDGWLLRAKRRFSEGDSVNVSTDWGFSPKTSSSSPKASYLLSALSDLCFLFENPKTLTL